MNKDWTKRSEWKTEPMRLIICGCGAVAGLLLALPLGAAQGGMRRAAHLGPRGAGNVGLYRILVRQ